MLFSPVTAVYYELTKKEIHRGSYWCEELQKEFNFPWWHILAIVYANTCCGNTYDKKLRNSILRALGLPEDKLFYY